MPIECRQSAGSMETKPEQGARRPTAWPRREQEGLLSRVTMNDSNHAHDSARLPLAEAETDPAADQLRRAAAFLPAELLQPDETIILLLKPSLWYVLLSCMGTLITFAVITIGAFWLAEFKLLQVSQREIVLLGVGLIGLRIIWQFFEWLSRVYVLTDRRVVRIRGVIRVSVFESPLRTIQHTSAFFSLRERIFGLGSIGFATAGTGTIEAIWEMIPSPLETHQQVVHAINRYR